MESLVKVLIWIAAAIVAIVACIVGDILFTVLFNARMGYLIRWAVGLGTLIPIGKTLSERWEHHCRHINLKALGRGTVINGKTRKDYLMEVTPKFILEICEGTHTVASIKEMLKPHVKAKIITGKMAEALAEEFGIS